MNGDTNGAIELEIIGMTCDHCKRAVENALIAVPRVTSVVVDGPNGRATVIGGSNVEALVEAIRSEGYDAQSLARPS